MAINYTKIGWDTSKYVNPTNMNQMDNGIKAACDAVDSISANYTKLTVNGFQTLISTSYPTPLYVQGSGSNTYIGFNDSNGTLLGRLGVNSSGRPQFFDTAAHEIAIKDDTVLKTDISAAKGVCRHYSYGVSDLDISDIQTALVNMMNDRANYPEFATPTSIIITFIKTTTGGSVSCRVACNGMGYFSAIFHSYYFGGDTYLLRYINGSWEKFRYSGTSF